MANMSPALLNAITYLLQQQQEQQQGQGSDPRKETASISYASGICPDDQCQMKLYYPTHEASVECPGCGQRHNIEDIGDRVVLKEKENKVELSIQQMRQAFSTSTKKAPDLVQVRGISNYQCKLLSPLLTTHGRDSKTDTAKPLTELGMGERFDCSKFGTRAFSIEEAQLETVGYGRDRSGSVRYLSDILQRLRAANDGKTGLVPLHADGDGHCLVHAISRCLVGRELFWHALRCGLYSHLTTNIDRYKATFKEFYEEEEWEKIIEEAAPDFQPKAGEVHGLCNIHVFGLANVLRRPIILLDSLSGIQSCGDYSGLFLPALHSPAECSSLDTATGKCRPHSPIVVAWSNSGRNHFVPLVPIRSQPLPKLPPALCPTVWGVGEELLTQYVEFEPASGSLEVCGGKLLSDGYMQKLVKCMEALFFQLNSVNLSVVADVHQTIFRKSGYLGVKPELVIETAKIAVYDNRLFRCLICNSITCVPHQWLEEGGQLYSKATTSYKLEDGSMYEFPMDGVVASYDATANKFSPKQVNCFHCTGVTRHLRADGSIAYENGDRTMTPAVRSLCGCGYRHYWDGNEYDNLPERIPLSLTWANQTVQLTVHWFQRESDPERNSNVYDIAQKVINEQFPGEFGSERLVQQIVVSIMHATERKENMEQVTGHHPPTPEDEKENPFNREEAHKQILTGAKSQTLHREELTMSGAERRVRAKVEENARVQQRKRSSMTERGTEVKRSSGKRSPVPQRSPIQQQAPLTPPSQPTQTTSITVPSSNSPPASKKIKVTSSDGRTANLTLDPNTTFVQLQAAIERELNIPAEQQRLRWGFPPRELRPSMDPTHPVELTNGERVSVDVVATAASGVTTKDSKEAEVEGKGVEERDRDRLKEIESAQKALDQLIQQLQETTGGGGDLDIWAIAQHQPHFFAKDGDYYKQVVEKYGGSVPDNTHFQFREFPGKTFAFNKKKESLEICLGRSHVPVGPLTPEQELLALAASEVDRVGERGGEVGAGEEREREGAAGHGEGGGAPQSMGLSGVVSRSEATVRAFSGRGQTLGSRHESEASDS